MKLGLRGEGQSESEREDGNGSGSGSEGRRQSFARLAGLGRLGRWAKERHGQIRHELPVQLGNLTPRL